MFPPTQIGWFPGVVSDWFPTGFRPVSDLFPHTNRVVSWSGFRLVSFWFPSCFKSFPPHKSGGFLEWFLSGFRLVPGWFPLLFQTFSPTNRVVSWSGFLWCPSCFNSGSCSSSSAAPAPAAASAPAQAWLFKIQQLSD